MQKLSLRNSAGAISAFLNQVLIPETKTGLFKEGKMVTGRTAASLFSVTNFEGNRVVGKMFSEKWLLYFAMFGRGPGTPPPISVILTWESIKKTGISPYAVQKSKAEKGTNPLYRKPDLFKNALSRARPQAGPIIKPYAKRDLGIYLRENLKPIYNNVSRAN